MSLPISTGPWQELPMDFIMGFPLTSPHHDIIWTIVDRFSKMAYFIARKKTLTAPQAIDIFIKHIFIHHGFPKVIVSDRDKSFVG